ncbi:hypothetical protein BKA57DRAFT_50157, partial [Linnemannia elongata]
FFFFLSRCCLFVYSSKLRFVPFTSLFPLLFHSLLFSLTHSLTHPTHPHCLHAPCLSHAKPTHALYPLSPSHFQPLLIPFSITTTTPYNNNPTKYSIMADTTTHEHVAAVPEVDAPAPAAAETTEAEATFSTAVEPSDAPVLHADDAPAAEAAEAPTEETSAEAPASGEEAAAAEGANDSPPASTGSDKKSKSWISKLAGSFKKLGDKKPKTEKAADAGEEGAAATATETDAAAPETTPEITVDDTAAAAPAATEAETSAAEATDASEATAEAAAEEKAAEETSAAGGDAAAPAPVKLAKRLSFNFFNKKAKADKEKEKTVAATPRTRG